MVVDAIVNQYLGDSILPDVGELAYNGVPFSSLYKSEIQGDIIEDDARRTTKFVTWSITVEGVVTLTAGQPTTDASWKQLRKLLSTHGGTLIYKGKGFGPLVVNSLLGGLRDVAYGPVPKILFFQPLGGSRAANIRWQVTTSVSETRFDNAAQGGQGQLPLLFQNKPPVLQWNYDASMSYDEEGYSSQAYRGTLEIPLSRIAPSNRTLQTTVDDFRRAYLNIQPNLEFFRVTRRSFNTSRDKRVCEFEFAMTEHAPMGLPIHATNARGTFSVRPLKAGGPGRVVMLAGMQWVCSLRCTYTIQQQITQTYAANLFHAMLWYRMECGLLNGKLPALNNRGAAAQQAKPNKNQLPAGLRVPPLGAWPLVDFLLDLFKKGNEKPQGGAAAAGAQLAIASKPLLMSWGMDEGLYNDSKNISFEASWYLPTTWESLLAACGFTLAWSETSKPNWAKSMVPIMGWTSWLQNRLDPAADVIVDLGGP